MNKRIEMRVGAKKGSVLQKFMSDKSRVSIIRGPLGSGKTIGAIQKVFTLMCEQQTDNLNVRRTRFVAIRNTYSDLFTTTIKDWINICGDFGKFSQGSKQPPNQQLKFKLSDSTSVEAEIIFLALDRPAHVKKLRGLQVTGVWLNETKEINKSVIDMADLRHGRYPERVRNKGKIVFKPTWHGIIGDTNAPDEDHWLAKVEQDPPEDWTIHVQAGGVIKRTDSKGQTWFDPNPHAENIENLPDNYYITGMQGKDESWIDVNLANNLGSVYEGKPVHPWFHRFQHTINDLYRYNPNEPLVVGVDFGRTPAAAFMQYNSMGRWHVFDELTTEDMSAQTFAPLLKDKIASLHPVKCTIWCDPAGSGKGEATDDTPIRMLQAVGLPAYPCLFPTARQNNIELRRASVSYPCTHTCMDGHPQLLVYTNCHMLIKGLLGGFSYRRLQVVGDERFTDVPDKSKYSHIVEALEYGLAGEGVGNQSIGYGNNTKKVVKVKLGGRH